MVATTVLKKFSIPLWLWAAGLFMLSSLSVGQSFNGPIKNLKVPPGWQHQFVHDSKAHVFTQGEQAKAILIWVPAFGMHKVMNGLLPELGLPSMVPVERTLDDRTSLVVQQNNGEFVLTIRLTELKDGYALTLLYSQTHSTTLELSLATVLKSLDIVAKQHPADLVDRFRTASEFSSSYGSDLGNASFSSYTTFWPNGTFTDGSYTSVSQPTATGLSGSSSVGLWEVRGDTLFTMGSDGFMSVFTYKSFSNGLELYTPEGQQLLWVRQ